MLISLSWLFASGKKSKPENNKFGQISSHGPSVEQQSVSVPHENRQETISSQSSNRILPIRAEQTSFAAEFVGTHLKVKIEETDDLKVYSPLSSVKLNSVFYAKHRSTYHNITFYR
jgi:hypothetical protein